MNNENEFIGWGDSFVAEGNTFKLFEPGEYPFVVMGYERKIYDGNSDKIPNGAPFAEIELEFTGPEGTTRVTERLFMMKKWQWKLTQFFTGIGQAPVVGQAFTPNWNKVVGSRGTASLKINKYTKRDGSEGKNNQVDKYLEPVANNSTIQSNTPQQAENQNTGFTPGAF